MPKMKFFEKNFLIHLQYHIDINTGKFQKNRSTNTKISGGFHFFLSHPVQSVRATWITEGFLDQSTIFVYFDIELSQETQLVRQRFVVQKTKIVMLASFFQKLWNDPSSPR